MSLKKPSNSRIRSNRRSPLGGTTFTFVIFSPVSIFCQSRWAGDFLNDLVCPESSQKLSSFLNLNYIKKKLLSSKILYYFFIILLHIFFKKISLTIRLKNEFKQISTLWKGVNDTKILFSNSQILFTSSCRISIMIIR